MTLEKLQGFARLTIATLSILGGLPGGLRPALAQSVSYPDASTTGVPAGTPLTAYTGPTNITAAGTVIDSKNITSCLTVSASNVTIKRSRVTCSGARVIQRISGTNLLIEDVEVVCSGNAASHQDGINNSNFTARRVNVHGCENGIWAGSNTLVEDSYIHDLVPYNSSDDPHVDGVQSGFSDSNVIIRHNRIVIVGDANAAMTAGSSGITNYLFENNLVAGAGYTVRCEGAGVTNYRVINNRFSRIYYPTVGFFGPQNGCDTNATEWSGNVYHETGQPLPGQPPIPAPSAPSAPTNLRIISSLGGDPTGQIDTAKLGVDPHLPPYANSTGYQGQLTYTPGLASTPWPQAEDSSAHLVPFRYHSVKSRVKRPGTSGLSRSG